MGEKFLFVCSWRLGNFLIRNSHESHYISRWTLTKLFAEWTFHNSIRMSFEWTKMENTYTNQWRHIYRRWKRCICSWRHFQIFAIPSVVFQSILLVRFACRTKMSCTELSCRKLNSRHNRSVDNWYQYADISTTYQPNQQQQHRNVKSGDAIECDAFACDELAASKCSSAKINNSNVASVSIWFLLMKYYLQFHTSDWMKINWMNRYRCSLIWNIQFTVAIWYDTNQSNVSPHAIHFRQPHEPLNNNADWLPRHQIE